MEQVRQQYQRFPYPPISALALPRRGQGQALQYEHAVELANTKGLAAIEPATHENLRILVVGCGTLEALLVAQNHPHAKEIVALDLSDRSLATLRRRLQWARLRDLIYLAPLRGQKLPSVKLVEADVNQWSDADGFDYILANNMLHHTEDPVATLKHLTSLLKPGGVMRIVTYPYMSRFWLRQTSAWLRWHGLTAETHRLKQRATEVINELPQPHPIRSCFESHSETASQTGLVDAFFHACENPLTPLQWQQATESVGLEWLGESQSPFCRAEFLSELLPATNKLSAWQQSQILDDLLELTTNPVWWFSKRGEINTPHELPEISSDSSQNVRTEKLADFDKQLQKEWYLASEIYWQLGQGLHRAERLLQKTGTTVEQLISVLRQEIGPRVARGGWEILGLTIGEYPTMELLQALQPIQESDWQGLQDKLGVAAILKYQGERVPGSSLTQQIEWLQLYYGPLQKVIGPLYLGSAD